MPHIVVDHLQQIQPIFQLYEQTYLSSKSLWYRKRPGKRAKSAPVPVEESGLDSDARIQAEQLLHSAYGRAAVTEYVESWLGTEGICYSKDMALENDKAYIMSLLAVLASTDRASTFTVKELGGRFKENAYEVPQLQISRKEAKK